MAGLSPRDLPSAQPRNQHVAVWLCVPLPLAPEPIGPAEGDNWDWDKVIPLEADCRFILELLVKFWFALLPSYRDSLELRWYQSTPSKKRFLFIEVILSNPEQFDAFSDAENSVPGVLARGTRELVRVIADYTRVRMETDTDIAIMVGDPQSGDGSAIFSLIPTVVDTAHELFMQDARRGSQRPALTALLNGSETIEIPAALGRYAFVETEGRLEVVGYFDELSDTRGQGLVRQADKKETYQIKIPRELRQGTAAAYFRKTQVRATLTKTMYSIAGSKKSGSYVLVDFRKIDDTFAQTPEFHESRETLDLFHEDRRSSPDKDFKGPERRTPTDNE